MVARSATSPARGQLQELFSGLGRTYACSKQRVQFGFVGFDYRLRIGPTNVGQFNLREHRFSLDAFWRLRFDLHLYLHLLIKDFAV
jgi:hypothetical protein